jgi:KipI family sensor histidine kinase inhibitor
MTDLDLRPAGDAAIVVYLGDRIDLSINRRVHALAAAVKQSLAAFPYVEVNQCYASLLVSYDPMILSHDQVAEAIRLGSATAASQARPSRRFLIPVLYGGDVGPDLEDVARLNHLTPEEVIRRHADRDYPIFGLGYSPGFPFLGDLDPSIHTPRLETPRASVPRGSVAIGGAQTGVYPRSLAGGWRIIGRTPLVLFDLYRVPPVVYEPGDLIRFERIDAHEYERLRAQPRMPEAG